MANVVHVLPPSGEKWRRFEGLDAVSISPFELMESVVRLVSARPAGSQKVWARMEKAGMIVHRQKVIPGTSLAKKAALPGRAM
jgi:hypothetical protein